MYWLRMNVTPAHPPLFLYRGTHIDLALQSHLTLFPFSLAGPMNPEHQDLKGSFQRKLLNMCSCVKMTSKPIL